MENREVALHAMKWMGFRERKKCMNFWFCVYVSFILRFYCSLFMLFIHRSRYIHLVNWFSVAIIQFFPICSSQFTFCHVFLSSAALFCAIRITTVCCLVHDCTVKWKICWIILINVQLMVYFFMAFFRYRVCRHNAA